MIGWEPAYGWFDPEAEIEGWFDKDFTAEVSDAVPEVTPPAPSSGGFGGGGGGGPAFVVRRYDGGDTEDTTPAVDDTEHEELAEMYLLWRKAA